VSLALTEVFQAAEDPVRFRKALGRFATGIGVVTALTPSGPVGVTINSFASVSLAPPLILWSPARASSRHDAFVSAARFAVHVLAGGQKPLCDHFIRAGAGFENLAHTLNDSGVPLLHGCAAIFECTREAVYEAGDHSIIIGRVLEVHTGESSALIFRNGQFERAG
jgi:flavin reductase (DIM6/NTAB) family NADH-FMN oxidoreductase RutF